MADQEAIRDDEMTEVTKKVVNLVTREHPLSETLAQLYRSPVFQSTVLRGLESADVGPLFRKMVDDWPGRERWTG